MFLLLFASPEQGTVVYYLDDHVGLLIDPETMNVVGSRLKPSNTAFCLTRCCRLCLAVGCVGLNVKDYGDLILKFNQTTRDVAREVIGLRKTFLVSQPRTSCSAGIIKHEPKTECKTRLTARFICSLDLFQSIPLSFSQL